MMPHVLRLTAALLVFPLLPSCITHVVALQQHPGFTHAAATRHLFIVGGVTSSVTSPDGMTRVRYADVLAQELATTFIDALIGLNSGEYPEPPSEMDVLEDVFQGFAENMPKPPVE